ncbi:MAG: TPM domain-containing protein [Chitinophagales bacterium]|nr:TPM domain-containing protein [Chitinophagales bacterium]
MKSAKVNKGRFQFWVLAGLLLLWAAGFAQNFPERPNPPRLVNDFATMLTVFERQNLEDKLVAYDDSTSTQISIVIIRTLNGMDKAQYATELGEKWGIGRKQKDNGVLILVASEDRQIFIATGRGVEEYLPDAICKRIIEKIIKPDFKEGKYYEGLDNATNEMIARLSGTFENTDSDDESEIPLWVIILIIFIVFFLLPVLFRNHKGGGTTYGGRGYRTWGGGTTWGGSSGGGWSGGGGSRGGFGGFGGGSFGGGGAGGSW